MTSMQFLTSGSPDFVAIKQILHRYRKERAARLNIKSRYLNREEDPFMVS